MSNTNTGGPAFPGFDYIDQHGKKNPEGMTLRDYFAAKAMQGWHANSSLAPSPPGMVAEWAYKEADAMLKARDA